jgi:glycosyltransferase involved in cell wall biosynthesis
VKVGVVTTSYPRFPDDPAGNFVGEHVRALRALGHDVEVIAAADAGDIDSRRINTGRIDAGRIDAGRIDAGRIDAAGIDGEPGVIRVPSAGLFYTGGAPDLLERAPRRFLDATMFSTRLAAVIARRARRWDSIVAHWLAPSTIACAIAAPRTPLLAIAHGGDVHTLRRLRLLAPVLHLLHARDAQIVFVSEELRAIALAAVTRSPFATRALARWITDARVQPMGIDVARFAAIPRAPTSPPTLVIASRLVPVKGIDVAIAAKQHLTKPARLVIAGEGPELAALVHAAFGEPGTPRPHVAVYTKTELAELERQHGIAFRFAFADPAHDTRAAHDKRVASDTRATNDIDFLGTIDTRARDRLLATASIVLVPSRVLGAGRSEGTPLIALEALAAGIPVIASAVGGLRTLRDVELVPPDDPEALARAIDRVLDAPPSAAQLRDAVAHLDWRRVIDTLVRSS